MPRTTVYIPEADRRLLARCRELNKDIEEWNKSLPKQRTIDLLSRLNLDDLPRRERERVRAVLWSKEKLEEKQAELDSIAIDAEKAAHRIENDELRRVAKLYCLDGLDAGEIAKKCSFSRSTVYQNVKLLKKRAESV